MLLCVTEGIGRHTWHSALRTWHSPLAFLAGSPLLARRAGEMVCEMSDALPTAAYVHVPFCRHRCGYCDFTLIAGRDDLVPAYLQGLARELRFHPTDPSQGTTPLTTLFLGGGTPTHPAPADVARLCELLAGRFTLAAGAEVTVEANPLDLTDEKLDVLVAQGVNRISLGVQSFSDVHLQTLERDHTQRDLARLLPRVRTVFPNLSLDLMFGVPGQTLDDWRESLWQAADSGATHISTYGLTFEAGTAFETRRRRGQFSRTPEELERAQYALAIELLTSAGFRHYEISNFARPGFECRHNQVYWSGGEYFAYGPGAARYVSGRRETNIRSVLGWLTRLDRNLSPVADVDALSAETRARELLFLGLRRIDGVSRAVFQEQTGRPLDELASEAIATHVARGWLEETPAGIRLTSEGLFVADRVVADFL